MFPVQSMYIVSTVCLEYDFHYVNIFIQARPDFIQMMLNAEFDVKKSAHIHKGVGVSGNGSVTGDDSEST